MAIYIKGVELPKTAFECSTKINPDERRCNYTGKVFEETYGLVVEHTCPDCPLVYITEPHGRLIDADEFCIGLYERWETADKDGEKVISSVLADVVVPIIVSTPTVIEGSE